MPKVSFNTNEDVTQALPIIPNEKFNNLCVVEIDSVSLDYNDGEGDENYEYRGLKIPTFAITFINHKFKADEEDRYYTHSIRPVVSRKNDGTPMKDSTIISLVTETYKHLKHIHDFLVKAGKAKPIKSVPAIDSDKAPAERLKDWDKFFTAFYKAFYDGDKPLYKGVPAFLKLIVNKGERKLAIPNFTNRGFIDVFKVDDKGNPITTLTFYGNETTEIPKVIAPDAPTAPTAAATTANVDLSKL